MSDPDTVRRQLKIKTGSVKRLWKEYGLYNREVEAQQKVVDKYIADEKDEYDIKNQRKILAESEKMIPDTQKRLTVVLGELKDLVVVAKTLIPEDKELKEAEDVLAEVTL